MPVTYAQLAAVVEEVVTVSVPSGVQKVYERDDEGVVLQLRGRGDTSYLLVDTTPGWGRVHLVGGKPKQPSTPSAFVMLLRKLLVGTGLQAVDLAVDDRVVELRFLRRTEDEAYSVRLVAELFGVRPCVVIVRDGLVVGQRGGRHTVGAAYVRPAGSAPGGDDPLDLAALPLGDRSSALARSVAELVAQTRVEGLRAQLAADLKREAKRARRLVSNLEGDLARAEEAQGFRRHGELLQSAYAQQVPRGSKSVKVPDYYAEGSPEVELELDPARSLQENIERYFHEYRRMNEAIDTITERLLEAIDAAEALQAARDKLATLEEEELELFEAQLRAQGVLRQRRRQAARRSRASQTPPYRTFLARSGAKILVGRGARHNDALTTKVARGRDVWMHARDWAGAHVVLRMDKDAEPDSGDLRDAALLAAHFSKGRGDSLVDVTHTRAKWVRKPKGAAPGLVTVAGGSTIAVQPDEERLAELFEGEVDR